jgi:hypothetical protein
MTVIYVWTMKITVAVVRDKITSSVVWPSEVMAEEKYRHFSKNIVLYINKTTTNSQYGLELVRSAFLTQVEKFKSV